jgi:hypothetical protein
MRFDERYGYTPVRLEVQVEDLSPETRTRLWNVFHIFFLDNWMPNSGNARHQAQRRMAARLWLHYFGGRHNSIPYFPDFERYVEHYFFDEAQWFQVYALVEAAANEFEQYGQSGASDEFRVAINRVFREDLCDVRFVGTDLLRVTEDEQVVAIESALGAAAGLPGARHHIEQAIALLRRETADYANSIKESISAVEAAATYVLGEKGTLGQALGKMEAVTGQPLHPALKGAWEKMYGYTSDADGIRHAAFAKPDADADDALYFLITCSAFVSYLLSKAT